MTRASSPAAARRRPRLVLGLAGVALTLAVVASGGERPAVAQLLETTTTIESTTTQPTAETTIPTTTAPPTTAAPATTRPPATRPTTTRPATTGSSSTTAPVTVPTTAPPEPTAPAPTTTVFVPERVTITQETPDLSGVMVLWIVGILGTVATMAVTWWRRRGA